MKTEEQFKLKNGSNVAVIGGGPAGTFFSIFMLDMAARTGLDINIEIYEPRDFSNAGPTGCNMCAGIVSETLVQMLATEGIKLPNSVIQRGIQSYTLHMDVGSTRIDTPLKEKRIGAVYRGSGPRDLNEFRYTGLDGYLLRLAMEKGAHWIRERVTGVTNVNGYPQLKTRLSESKCYDLVAVTTGVNSQGLKMFQNLGLQYQPPETTKTHLREYYLGKEKVTEVLGNSIQIFLLDIPGLEVGMLIPKADYLTVCILGEEIDKDLVHVFLDSPEVRKCLTPTLQMEQFSCHCSPRMNTSGAAHPYADRFVFIGDCSTTRYFKDGIGSAYRGSKKAAATAIFQGVSAKDFEKHYFPFCQEVEYDNDIGKLMFMVVKRIQKLRFARKAMLRMILSEQEKPGKLRRMSTIQWDMYTGSSSYKEIFMRTLHPAFLLRLGWDILVSIFSNNLGTQSKNPTPVEVTEHEETRAGKLGKRYLPGDILIHQGEVGECMYVIQEGQVALMRRQGGEDVLLGVRSAGEVLGENAIFEKEVHTAEARALSEVRVITVDKDNFNRRIHEDPSLAYHLFQLNSRRIREMSQQIVLLNQALDRYKERSSPI